MKRLDFSVEIAAPPSRVWHHLFTDESFRKWTAAFTPGSHFQGSWMPGDTIRFLDPNGDGMLSRVTQRREGELMSLEHFGIVKGGQDVTEGPEAAQWTPAVEEYCLTASDSGTQLKVASDTSEAMESFFSEAWPRALARLKEICESED